MEEYLDEFTAESTFGPDGYLIDKGLIPMPDAERKKFQKDGEMMANNISM
jgi:phosphate transport system substrate-binding protein